MKASTLNPHVSGVALRRRDVGTVTSEGRAAQRTPMRSQFAQAGDAMGPYSPGFLFAAIAAQIFCQIALLSSFFASSRVVFRVAAFGPSLAMLFFPRRGRSKGHPSSRFAIIALLTLAASIPRPDTQSVWAGVASVFLHLAILAPIFWVGRIRLDGPTIRKVFLLFWVFHTLSALTGALQVYFPGSFQPAIAATLEDEYVQGLRVALSSGETVLRPMGLTDSPGGASMAALYSVLLGVGLLMDRPRWWFRIVIVTSMAFGLFVLYMCEVRSVVVMLAISVIAIGLPLAAQRRIGSFAMLVSIVSILAVIGFALAVSVADKDVMDRFRTLFESDPGTVYYSNRGNFLEYTITDLLPQYPLGAGLGRWGMIHSYFADSRSDASQLWAEIQWTGWLFDGGLPLIVAYAAGVITALATAYRIATRSGPGTAELQKWATVLFGYGVGALALTFDGAIFEGTAGIDFWLLNATVFAASEQLGDSA